MLFACRGGRFRVNKRSLVVIAVGITLLGSVLLFQAETPDDRAPINATAYVYYSATCGCCKAYSEYLRSQGAIVWPIETANLSGMKDRFGVPGPMRSCHTADIGDYFVEGHVPAGAIRKLLEERPDVAGIGLPGMPPGSPGMGGVQTGPLVIYSVSGAGIQEYLRL